MSNTHEFEAQRIAVMGTGMVGQALAGKLADLGHQVTLGSRTPDNATATAWAAERGENASHGTFAAAAAKADVVILAVKGEHVMSVIEQAGPEQLAGKIVLDITNPLDFSKGFPPSLFVPSDDSLGERVQRALPRSKVVKTLNTVTASLMVEPGRLPGQHAVFVSGDDAEARATVARWLKRWFGWPQVIDLGEMSTARGTEAWLMLWVRLWGSLGTAWSWRPTRRADRHHSVTLMSRRGHRLDPSTRRPIERLMNHLHAGSVVTFRRARADRNLQVP